jgi:protein-tyrosine-phosphatase
MSNGNAGASWLVVCSGNTCRSPLLMFLIRHRLAQLGLERIVVVESAGVPRKSSGSSVSDEKAVLPFATEGLRTALRWLNLRHGIRGDVNVDKMAKRAALHRSRLITTMKHGSSRQVTHVFAMAKHQGIRWRQADGSARQNCGC